MKYIVLTLAAVILCILLGIRLVAFFTRKHRILKGCLAGLLLIVLTGAVYLMIYYHAGETALTALKGTETVRVQKIHQGYFFDGPGEEEALIFYPGAKVETEAYAPLMLLLAEQGADAFLVDMPLRMAFLNADAAGSIMAVYNYDRWFLAGHSLGGTVASSCALDLPLDGLILLASYPTKQLDLPLLSIYGSEDGCLGRKAYENSRGLWPDDAREVVIQGANHAQFGDYGAQKGDGKALITAKEQQEMTVRQILEWTRR